jgi:transcriptional regulator with XRE-family HTH domain
MDWAYRYRTAAEIGVMIVDLREQHAVSVETFCEAAHATPERLAKIETGRSSVCGYDINACELLFGIRGHQLLTTEPSLHEKWGISTDSPLALREAADLFTDLIDDYFGIEALVGSRRR